jgi:hypothetical protein
MKSAKNNSFNKKVRKSKFFLGKNHFKLNRTILCKIDSKIKEELVGR